MNPQPTIDVMRGTAQALQTGDVREKLRAIQTLQDATDAAKAVLLSELEASKDFELDGAPTINAWVRTQLRLNAGTGELFEAVKHLKDVTHPEDLDDASEKGMDKEDF